MCGSFLRFFVVFVAFWTRLSDRQPIPRRRDEKRERTFSLLPNGQRNPRNYIILRENIILSFLPHCQIDKGNFPHCQMGKGNLGTLTEKVYFPLCQMGTGKSRKPTLFKVAYASYFSVFDFAVFPHSWFCIYFRLVFRAILAIFLPINEFYLLSICAIDSHLD